MGRRGNNGAAAVHYVTLAENNAKARTGCGGTDLTSSSGILLRHREIVYKQPTSSLEEVPARTL